LPPEWGEWRRTKSLLTSRWQPIKASRPAQRIHVDCFHQIHTYLARIEWIQRERERYNAELYIFPDILDSYLGMINWS
jgi:hypothetical protein